MWVISAILNAEGAKALTTASHPGELIHIANELSQRLIWFLLTSDVVTHTQHFEYVLECAGIR